MYAYTKKKYTSLSLYIYNIYIYIYILDLFAQRFERPRLLAFRPRFYISRCSITFEVNNKTLRHSERDVAQNFDAVPAMKSFMLET